MKYLTHKCWPADGARWQSPTLILASATALCVTAFAAPAVGLSPAGLSPTGPLSGSLWGLGASGDSPPHSQVGALEIPDGLTPTYHSVTGSLTALVGRARVAGTLADGEAAQRAGRALLARLGPVLGAQGFRWEVKAVGQVAGIHTLRFVPEWERAELDGAFVRILLSQKGELLRLDAYGLREAPLRAPFVVGAADAAELARVAAPGATDFARAQRPRRVLVQGARGLEAAWRVRVFDPMVAAGQWSVLVSASTGEVTEARREAMGSMDGTVTGRAKAAGSPSYGAPAAVPLASLYVSGIADGAGMVRVTTDVCLDGQVAISSDGSRIVWAKDCGAQPEIWTALTDGSGLTQLTSNGDSDHSPTISADGSTIVFVSDRDGDEELFAMDSTGGALRQLTFNTVADVMPSVDDAGARVAYASGPRGAEDVWLLDLATLGSTAVATGPGSDRAPALSGDSSSVAFLSDREGDVEVYVQVLGGGPLHQMTFDVYEQERPSISDDGELVAFASRDVDFIGGGGTAGTGSIPAPTPSAFGGEVTRYPNWSIWTGNVVGGDLTRVTDTATVDRHPVLSGDGLILGYVRIAPGGTAIFIMEELTSGTDFEVAPTVQSQGPDISRNGGAGVFVGPEGAGSSEVYAFGALLLDRVETDAAGNYSLPFPDGLHVTAAARLRGKFAKVIDLDPGTSSERASVSATTPIIGQNMLLNPLGNDALPEAQVTGYVQATAAHAWVAGVLSSPRLVGATTAPIDVQARIEVNGPAAVHNAFFFPGTKTMRFFKARGPFESNTAIRSVIWHEYGHFVDDRYNGLNRINANEHPGGLSEGFADTVAMLGLGLSDIGAEFDGPGTVLRDYLISTNDAAFGSEDRHYDCSKCGSADGRPEPHQHGEALANFALRLRELRPTEADELVVGALAMGPVSMQDMVDLVALLAAQPGFCAGCANDVANDLPLYLAICRAAASAGFQCPGRPDVGSQGCGNGICGGNFGEHFAAGTEWLGATVIGNDLGCAGGDDDGVAFASVPIAGEPLVFDVTLSVAPVLLSKGRYTRDESGAGIDTHAVYLNAWLYLADDLGNFGAGTKVLGTGSGSPFAGDLPIGSPDTMAFDPNLWMATSKTFRYFIDLPDHPERRAAILRFRLDYGENAGLHSLPRSFPGLLGPCGIARFGEVEDYLFDIIFGGDA